MHTNYLAILISIIAFGSFSSIHAQDSITTTESDLSEIDSSMLNLISSKMMEFPSGTELSIGLVKNGETIFLGFKRTDSTINKVGNQHRIFQIGSITKVFTSTLLARNIVDGHMSLLDTIGQYIDSVKTGAVTMEMLANHTSGYGRLPNNMNMFSIDINDPYKNYGEPELLDLLRNYELFTEAKEYSYSNLGAGVLAYVLTQDANRNYEELLQEYIFQKYDMPNSTTDIDRITNHLVDGLKLDGTSAPYWDFNILAGAGAIFSSTGDLAKFIIAQCDSSNVELLLTQKPTHQIREGLEIGLGWHIRRVGTNSKMLIHDGGVGGFTSCMAIHVNDHKGIVILSNVSAYHPNSQDISTICIKLLDSL